MAVYFQKLGVTNYENDEFGQFLQYIFNQQLNDPALLMNNAIDFSISSYVNLTTEKQKQDFIFDLVQHWFKHSQFPSDQYIKNYLVQQMNGYEKNENSPSFSEHKNDGLIEEEGAAQTTNIGEMGEVKEPGFDDGYEGSVGIDNYNDDVLILDPMIEIPLKQSILDWNSCANRKHIYFVQISELFDVYNINYRWIEEHTRRDFMVLLKEELGIPMAASTKIWKRFQSFVFIEEPWDYLNEYKHEFQQDPYSVIEIDENTADDMAIINQLHP